MNIGSKEWIAYHQRVILWFCNATLIRYYIRWKLRIFYAVDWHIPITRVDDDAFDYETDEGTVTVFYTHAKIGKRLFFGFLPVWMLFHFWDMCIDRPFALGLNLGFDTTTDYYPDPSHGGSSCDGEMIRFGGSTTWASFQSGNGTGADDTGSTVFAGYLQSTNSATPDTWLAMQRGKLTFATGGLGAMEAVTAASLNVFFNNKQNGLGGLDAQVCKSAGSSNSVAATDYQALDNTDFGHLIYSGFVAGYNVITLSTAAVLKTAQTMLGMRLICDATNSPPTWIQNKTDQMSFTSADHIGTSNDPFLRVVHHTLVPNYKLGYYVFKGIEVTQDENNPQTFTTATGHFVVDDAGKTFPAVNLAVQKLQIQITDRQSGQVSSPVAVSQNGANVDFKFGYSVGGNPNKDGKFLVDVVILAYTIPV